MKRKRRLGGSAPGTTDRRAAALERILGSWPDVVLLVDRELTIGFRSRESIGAVSIAGVGDRLVDMLHPADAARVTKLVEQLSRTPGAVSTIGLQVGSGHGVPNHFEATFANLLHDDTVAAIVVWLQDVGRWIALEQQLRRQALHDPLTGLPNRVLLRDRVGHALVRDRDVPPVALLLLGIDRFRTVNDRFGHAAGDELLTMIAERLHALVRVGETVARFGGDEFAILMEGVDDPTNARLVAGRVLEGLRAPFELGATQVCLDASVGIALGRDGAADVDELFRHADIARYEAKNRGGGCHVTFEPPMDAAVREDRGYPGSAADVVVRVATVCFAVQFVV